MNPQESREAAEAAAAKQQAAAPEHDDEQPPLADQLQIALAERDTHLQNWLRSQADLENYRKRTQKEMEQERQYRALPLVRDVLPILDNLQRALDAARTSNDPSQLVQGVQMVAKQFEDVLGKHAVKPIDAVGQPFDPNLHQAIQQMPAADKPPMTVLCEYEKGYTLHDRVVRPSVVVVSAPLAEEEAK